AFFLAATSRKYCFASVSIMPLIALQTSLAALWDTWSSLPLAFAVFSGSSISLIIEYPHFGIITSPMRNQTRKSNLYGFPYHNYDFSLSRLVTFPAKGTIRTREVYSFGMTFKLL